MNRLGLLILAILKEKSAISPLSAISLYEVKSFANLEQSITTMHRTANYLLEQNLIEVGVKDSKSKTFFLTTIGNKTIKEMV